MATKSQIDKISANTIANKMRRLGFAVEKSFYFWRKRGPLFDVLWSEILSGGDVLRINVTILCPWIERENGEFEKFPVAESLIGGSLSDEFPNVMHGGQLFNIGSDADIEKSFNEIYGLLCKHAIPWFNSINSYESYCSYVGQKGFHPTKEFREQVKKGIALGFEKEPL